MSDDDDVAALLGQGRGADARVRVKGTRRVGRARSEFGENSAEYLFVTLFRNMPYRGDLHSLVINPEDKSKGNYLHINGDTYTIVINEEHFAA